MTSSLIYLLSISVTDCLVLVNLIFLASIHAIGPLITQTPLNGIHDMQCAVKRKFTKWSAILQLLVSRRVNGCPVVRDGHPMILFVCPVPIVQA